MNSVTQPDKELEPFLHAVIHEDPEGPALTMLSALARRDLDPWDEAASLAGMDPEAAVLRLMALLRSLPAALRPVDVTLALRLQALLPRIRSGASGKSPAPLMKAAWQTPRPVPTGPAAVEAPPRSSLSYLLIYLVFVAILVGSEWLNASGEAVPPVNVDHASGGAGTSPTGAPRGTAAPINPP
jgi:hypothetical protein